VAGFKSLAATGLSIQRLLNACFEADQNLFHKRPKAILARSEDFEKAGSNDSNIVRPGLSLFFYRADINKTTRAAWSAVGSLDGIVHLPIDLHFLIAPWDDNAEFELEILGRAMECLETTPILRGPLLHPDGGWATNEAIQVVLEDISQDSVLQTFDSLAAKFRLSVPYVARVLRIESRDPIVRPDVGTVVTGMTPTARQPL
jgi:Pvc16 N-terminal domain